MENACYSGEGSSVKWPPAGETLGSPKHSVEMKIVLTRLLLTTQTQLQ